jgi:hypothetical protein
LKKLLIKINKLSIHTRIMMKLFGVLSVGLVLGIAVKARGANKKTEGVDNNRSFDF